MLRKVLWLALGGAVLLGGLWGSRMLQTGEGREPRGPGSDEIAVRTPKSTPKVDVTPAQERQIQQDTAAVAPPPAEAIEPPAIEPPPT